MRKIKILYIHHTFRPQSYNSLLLELAKRINRDRYEIAVCCLREGGPYEQKFKDIGLDVKNLNMKTVLDIRIIPRLIKYIKKKKVDVVHTALIPADVYGLISARLAGVPLIFSTIHNVDYYWQERKYFLYRAADRVSMRFATHIVAVSKAVENFISQWPEMRSNITTIYNGIDSQKYNENIDARNYKTELGLQGQVPTVGVTARIVRDKGLEFLLEAASYILQGGRQVQFLVVGDGPLRGKLESHAKKLRIEHNVFFTGFREDIPQILAILDIFVLPSLCEALPTSIIEAMFSGKPIIATNVGGIPEVVVDGETGILIPPKDSKILAEAITELLDSPEKRKRMGEMGRQRAFNHFSVEKMVENYEKFYWSFYNKRGG